MKLTKAIEIIKDIEPSKFIYFLDNEKRAIKLGFEAGKRLEWYRKHHRVDADTPLPGETKD